MGWGGQPTETRKSELPDSEATRKVKLAVLMFFPEKINTVFGIWFRFLRWKGAEAGGGRRSCSTVHRYSQAEYLHSLECLLWIQFIREAERDLGFGDLLRSNLLGLGTTVTREISMMPSTSLANNLNNEKKDPRETSSESPNGIPYKTEPWL